MCCPHPETQKALLTRFTMIYCGGQTSIIYRSSQKCLDCSYSIKRTNLICNIFFFSDKTNIFFPVIMPLINAQTIYFFHYSTMARSFLEKIARAFSLFKYARQELMEILFNNKSKQKLKILITFFKILSRPGPLS